MKRGQFIISLDFELHWGAPEKWDLKNREEYFKATRYSIPYVLDLFKKYSIHSTWATVGFLFAKNKEQLLNFSPTLKPNYDNKNLFYYDLLNTLVGEDEEDDPFHYGYSLIKEIINTPGQELATHTFSHYYCNEKGQNIEQFNEDLKAAQKISKENFGIELESLVFPRNQFNVDYLNVAQQNGIKRIRSNPDVWFWKKEYKFNRLARALDTLIPISSSLSFNIDGNNTQCQTLLVPASRFLRPYSKNEKLLQQIKFNRIKREMTYAAKKGNLYHLWWHPHNFGHNVKENLFYLEEILKHYDKLKVKYSFLSKSMNEVEI